MKIRKLIICAAGMGIALSMSAGTANAGYGTLKGPKGKVAIDCTSGTSCIITTFSKSGKRLRSSTKAGGRRNFKKFMKSYKAKGYR